MSRRTRYEDFEKFTNSAEGKFKAFLDSDEKAKVFSNLNSFHVVKGGAMGGVDKRTVEVFFGNRPFDHVKTFESQNGTLPQVQNELLVEGGARLHYMRTDIGTVICNLIPASTKNAG